MQQNITFENLTFKNGLATIKEGRKILAKVYDRPEFFKGTKVVINSKYPYSIEIKGGMFECENKEDVNSIFVKYADWF